MNLFVIGDYTYGDPETFQIVGDLLDELHSQELIEHLYTFDENGSDHHATVWAYEEKIPFTLIKEDMKSDQALANSFLRRIVDENKIDAFLFVFFDKEEKNPKHRQAVRMFYSRAKKAFKQKKVYVNKLLTP